MRKGTLVLQSTKNFAIERESDERNGPAEIDTPEDAYWKKQIQSAHRIFSTLYPEARFHYDFKALRHYSGTPDQVVVARGSLAKREEQILAHIDEGYLGSMVAGNPSPRAKEFNVAIPVPRDSTDLPNHADHTWPVFPGRGVAGRVMDCLLRLSPVLLEEAKYRYEMHLLENRTNRHSFVPVTRVASRALTGPRMEWNTARKPAILIGFHWLETGGAERLAFDCVEWALKAGLRVFVIADKSVPQRLASKLPDSPDVEFVRLDAYLPQGELFKFLMKFIQAENIRAVHIHHHLRLYDNLLKLKALFPDLVVIDSTHIVEHSDGGFPRTSGVWTKYIDHHHVISRQLVSFYLDNFGVSQKVRLGRMLPFDDKDSDEVPTLRLKAGQRTCRLAFVGRMVHQKRAPLIVDLARNLRKWAHRNDIELRVDMVGTGAYLDVVKRMIDKASLSNTIKLHPPTADVDAILSRADILVLPSGNEGLALVGYEAIANGAIPISTDVGGQRELVAEGLLVRNAPMHCVRDMTALIQRLMTDAEFLASCKTETVARYLDLRRDTTAEEVLSSIYTDVLSKAERT